MNDDFPIRLQSKLADFREWSANRTFTDCRLVEYCGVELVGTQSLHLTDVERQIEGLVCEAFYVDWAEQNGRLYLRVWEHGGPEPPWPSVFSEKHLADIDRILRDAGM